MTDFNGKIDDESDDDSVALQHCLCGSILCENVQNWAKCDTCKTWVSAQLVCNCHCGFAEPIVTLADLAASVATTTTAAPLLPAVVNWLVCDSCHACSHLSCHNPPPPADAPFICHVCLLQKLSLSSLLPKPTVSAVHQPPTKEQSSSVGVQSSVHSSVPKQPSAKPPVMSQQTVTTLAISATERAERMQAVADVQAKSGKFMFGLPTTTSQVTTSQVPMFVATKPPPTALPVAKKAFLSSTIASAIPPTPAPRVSQSATPRSPKMMIKCPLCPMLVLDQRTLDGHVSKAHHNSLSALGLSGQWVPKPSRWTCHLCPGKQFMSNAGLVSHWLVLHERQDPMNKATTTQQSADQPKNEPKETRSPPIASPLQIPSPQKVLQTNPNSLNNSPTDIGLMQDDVDDIIGQQQQASRNVEEQVQQQRKKRLRDAATATLGGGDEENSDDAANRHFDATRVAARVSARTTDTSDCFVRTFSSLKLSDRIEANVSNGWFGNGCSTTTAAAEPAGNFAAVPAALVVPAAVVDMGKKTAVSSLFAQALPNSMSIMAALEHLYPLKSATDLAEWQTDLFRAGKDIKTLFDLRTLDPLHFGLFCDAIDASILLKNALCALRKDEE